ncbi:MAG: DUF4845 domain-containing protein [Gammaproteobacteria bacterium]|jgi:Tfp pilus assembly major pilin PilA
MRGRQQGITLIGFIVVLVVLACFAYLAMRIIPMYSEYYGIVQALVGVSKEPGIATADERVIRDHISRHFEVGYVDSIGPDDIKLKRTENGLTMSVDYEVRKPLVYNLFILGHFEKTVNTGPAKPGEDQ